MTDDDGRQPIAIGHLSYSGEIKDIYPEAKKIVNPYNLSSIPSYSILRNSGDIFLYERYIDTDLWEAIISPWV